MLYYQHQTTLYTPEKARLTMRDYKEISKVLEGQQGTSNGKDWVIHNGKIHCAWVFNYTPATLCRPAEWEDGCSEDRLDLLVIDEEQALWLLHYYKEDRDEIALYELAQLFAERATK